MSTKKKINESKNNITTEINEIKTPITREYTGKLDNVCRVCELKPKRSRLSDIMFHNKCDKFNFILKQRETRKQFVHLNLKIWQFRRNTSIYIKKYLVKFRVLFQFKDVSSLDSDEILQFIANNDDVSSSVDGTSTRYTFDRGH